MKTTLLQLSVIFLVAFMQTQSSLQAQVRWMPDESVRTGAGGSMDVKMAFNNAHSVAASGVSRFITWVRTDSLFVAESVSGGAWSAPRLITRGSAQMNLPTIAATSDGRLCIGWHEPNGVKTTFSTDGGKTWGAAQILASRGAALSLAAGQNGVLYALWHSGNDDTPSDMMFATWQNGAWSAAKAIDAASATNAALWGSLCVSGTTLFAVWRENTTGEFRVYLTRSVNGGVTWEVPRNVVKEDRSGDPTVAFASGQVIVAYQRAQQIYTITSGDAAGTTFNAPNLIGPGLFARVIANDNGLVAVAWERFTGTNGRNDAVKQTGFVYSTDYGFTFSKDSALSAMGSKLGLVQFTGANEITASWFNVNNGGTVVAKRASVGNMVAVHEIAVLEASIAPNPASGVITLRLPSPTQARVRVMNMLGSEVLQASVNGTAPTLDVSLLARGAYMVEVWQGSAVARQILILQ